MTTCALVLGLVLSLAGMTLSAALCLGSMLRRVGVNRLTR